MAKVNLLSQKEYAQHRGCSPAAVCKAVKEGRISADRDGKIDPAVADIQWGLNTRARTRNVSSGEPTPGPVASAPGPVDAIAEPDGQLPLSDEPDGVPAAVAGDPKYTTSRASREEAVARREWLRLLEDEGQLVRVDQVRASLAARLAPVREALMQLPARLAPLIAAETEAVRIQNMLEASIHEILAKLRPE